MCTEVNVNYERTSVRTPQTTNPVSVIMKGQLMIFKDINAVYCKDTKVKVKVTLVQALRLCTGRTAHSGSTGIALPFLDHGTRKG